MDEEMEVLRQHVESLGLHEKDRLTTGDWSGLETSLRESDESSLADYIEKLGSPAELQDLIVNTLYG